MDPMLENLFRNAPKLDVRGEHFSVLEELRNPGYAIPEIATSAFVDQFLPPLRPGINVKDIVKSLKRDGLLGSKGRRRRSRASLRNGAKKRVVDAPACLAEIFDKATSAVSQSAIELKQTIKMLMLPKYQNPEGAITRSSACLALRNATERRSVDRGNDPASLSWFDIALTAEFCKASCDASSKSVSRRPSYSSSISYCLQNANRIIHNIQRIMARDPCRRLAFGITVEDTSIRLWFCSRSTPVVSEAFDFAAVSISHSLIIVYSIRYSIDRSQIC